MNLIITIMIRRNGPVKRHCSLSSSKVWWRLGVRLVRGRRCSFEPAGGSPEGGGHETSRGEFSGRQERPSSFDRLLLKTSCPSSLVCGPSLPPLKEIEFHNETRSFKAKYSSLNFQINLSMQPQSRQATSDIQAPRSKQPVCFLQPDDNR